ncbi:MAG: phage tail tape measure protein, partial [Pseudomonadota bacterium]
MSDVREFLGSMDEVLDTMSQGTGVASAFREELQRTSLEMTRAKNETAAARSIDRKLTQSFSTGIKGAVDELVINGSKLSDALRGIANSVIQTAYSASVKPVTDHIGGAVGGLFSNLLTGFTPFAKGGVFSQGSVTPFASGGVVNG